MLNKLLLDENVRHSILFKDGEPLALFGIGDTIKRKNRYYKFLLGNEEIYPWEYTGESIREARYETLLSMGVLPEVKIVPLTFRRPVDALCSVAVEVPLFFYLMSVAFFSIVVGLIVNYTGSSSDVVSVSSLFIAISVPITLIVERFLQKRLSKKKWVRISW